MADTSQKNLQLEQQVKLLMKQCYDLNRRVDFLERENTRRRSETNQIAAAINRKG
jgi:hypothetical protein